MAGSYVFPGGKVDAGDADPGFWAPRGDIGREALAERFHDTGPQMPLLAYAVAAIRETWEEAGVLLAQTPNGGGDLLERLAALRASQALTADWLREEVAAGGLTIGFTALWPWSRWIAPEALAQRFDTRFFIAFLPEGQRCRPDPRETPEGGWMTPREALAANDQGKLRLSPPTLVTLHGLLAHETVDALKAALPRPGWGPGLMPKMVFPKVGPMVIQPWDPAYAAPEETLPARGAHPERLPVGAPFSRLWNDAGTWRPVA